MDGFLITGIGASAGGIQALKIFFESTPADPGIAYVVILHLSPNRNSQLAEILQHSTRMPVMQVNEKTHIQPNRVYVIPPDKHLDMQDGYLLVSPNINVAERRAPIDIFFRSLAESHKTNAVGVILSGTGANGSMGLKRIKERGGAVYAQNPREAEYNEMPRNAIATNLVDEILNVADIPAAIVSYRDSIGTLKTPDDPAERQPDDQKALRAVLGELRLHTGHDFTNYKQSTLLRRIERRTYVHNLPSLSAYATFIHENREEIFALLKDVLISVTNFFRDKKAFEELETSVLPQLFKAKSSDDSVRIWVAGCATGEEAYTIAMICSEITLKLPDAPKFQIFATDIDEAAIGVAREGLYTLNDAADVPHERLNRYFTKEHEGYRVRRELRESILFANHNFLKDAPFSRIDLVTCRNVLIYLNRTAQERVFQTFHFALKPGGFLMLATAESSEGVNNLFQLYSRDQHIWRSRQVAARHFIVPETVPRIHLPKPNGRRLTQPQLPERISLGELHLHLIELQAPPSVVINADHNILHVSERAGRFLRFAGGELTQNLLKMVPDEIRIHVRNALYQAAEHNTPVSAPGLTAQIGHHIETINVHVRPVPIRANIPHGFLLVIFETAETQPIEQTQIVSGDNSARQLEEQLSQLKEQLLLSTRHHDFRTEELKAGNEELQAMNEELQSATEEMETSKEELQSINEELTTVNQELKVKVDELNLTTNNLRNIINSTDFGTIILDRAFRLVLYTPAAQNIFNLIPADQTRPLSDITNRLRNDDLITNAEKVLETLQGIESEMETTDGRIYLTRITPYRTEEDRIHGVVISFIDISRGKKAESALRAAEEWRKLILESAQDFAIFSLDLDRNVSSWNIGAQNVFNYTNEEIIGKSGDILFVPEDREKGDPVTETDTALKEGRAANERWQMRKNSSRFWGSGLTHPLRDESGQPIGFVKIMRDLTDQRVAEEAVRVKELRQSYLLKLGDALRPLTGPVEIHETAARIIGEQLGVNRALYCDVERGRGNVAKSGSFLLQEYESGRTVVVNNVTADARLSDEERAEYGASDVYAFMGSPVVKDGKLVSVLVVNHLSPRTWTQVEIDMADETAERTWAAVERAKTEKALAESEEKYRTLFNSIDEGFTTGEVLFDEAGKAVDYRMMEMNQAHERMSGMPKSVIGKPISELTHEIDSDALAKVGQVALTGEPLRYEHYSSALGRWFDVFTARVGDGDSRIVANVYNDITARKLAEQALRASETHARILADAIPHIIWTNDRNGKANYFNKRWVEYSGLTEGESKGAGWQTIVHPDDAPVSIERWSKALAEGKVFDTEYRLRSNDGSYRWFIGRNVPLRNPAGEVTGWFGSATDIHDLKQAQEQLARSEERLRVTTESALDYSITSMDTNRLIQGWSRGAEQIFGYTQEEIMGHSADIIFTPEDRAAGAPQKEMETARRDGMSPDERWHMRKDGSRFFMSGVMRPIYDHSKLSGYVKVARDMTRQKEAEEKLRLSEERYRVALTSAKMAAWDWDVVADKIVWNDQHYFILGLQPDGKEKTSDFFMSFIHSDDEAVVNRELQNAIDRHPSFNAEFRIIRRDNSETRWMSGFGRAVTRNDAGRAIRIVGVMQDITDRKRLDEQKDEFIGIASHELRTPVTSIKAYTEILQELFEESGDRQHVSLMQKLDGQVDRLTTLIYSLLDTTRISEGKLQLQKSEFKIDELIADSIETMQRIAGSQVITRELNANVNVYADFERIRQVVINLIANAIKYATGTERIIVSSRANDEFVTVCIQDFGIGIDEVTQRQVFDRFFRSDEANTFAGLGLGLYISAAIVREHRGTIAVNSAKGTGATFCFTIPLTEQNG